MTRSIGSSWTGTERAPGFSWRGGIAVLVLLAWVAGCRTRQAAPPPSRLDAAKLVEIDTAVEGQVAAGKLPGGVVWLEHRGEVYRRAYGNRSVEPTTEPMTVDTIFDAASLTKVLATTPAVMKLVETGAMELDAPVQRYLPEFGVRGKEGVTIRHLMTHVSGLRPGISPRPEWYGLESAITLACGQDLTHAPGTRLVYSDINFIVLGELVRRVSGRPLDIFVRDEIYRPLEMSSTGFNRIDAGPEGPWSLDDGLERRIAPTERLTNGVVLRGVVHDPTARRMGGVAGHAGLFTTAEDVARFARMMLQRGMGPKGAVFRRETVDEMVRVQTVGSVPARGLGWDIDSPYAGPRGAHFPVGSYGHTGWTGTSLWVNPGSETFIILMSNRNHPTEAGDVRALRRQLGTLAAEALLDVPFPTRLPVSGVEGVGEGIRSGTNVPAAMMDPLEEHWGAADKPEKPADVTAVRNVGVLNGIDVLARDGFRALRGRRVGLITNHTGHDRERRATIDLLHQAKEVNLVALFSPEHGIRGLLDEAVSDGRDERTGLPVYSLYGERRAPTEAQLSGLDVLVFDIQDIGCRFYTYISTLGNCMEVAGKAGVDFMVLDRVNPVTGSVIEGPLLTGERSFVAWHEIPIRHGMTVGELAWMFKGERDMPVKLEVIRVEGWQRNMWMDGTGLPWTDPSPNMRSLTQATLYPGVGVLEFCHLSVGRGTGTPFEVLGAPYIDDIELAREMNGLGIAGVRFVPIRFKPDASKFKGETCGGVRILLTDRNAFRSMDLGVGLAGVLYRLYGEALGIERMERLLGDRTTLEAIRSGQSIAAIREMWGKGLASFDARRRKHALY